MVGNSSNSVETQDAGDRVPKECTVGKPILYVGGSNEDATRFNHGLRSVGLNNGVAVFPTVMEARLYLSRVACGQGYTAHLWPGVVVVQFGSPGADTFRLIDWLHKSRSLGEFMVVGVAHPDQPKVWERACETGIEACYVKPVPAHRWRALAEKFPRCWRNVKGQD